MKVGEKTFIYHSGENTGIVGIAEVIKEFYPDPTAKEGDWSVIDIKPVRKLKRFISLHEIKQISELKNMYMIRSKRLSVQLVELKEFNFILKLENI
jgi:predicted RNA-binding protein with PUA-like domain